MIDQTFVIRGPNEAKRLLAFVKLNAAAMAKAGRPLAVVISEHKAKRTRAQERLLHAILGQIAEQAWVGGRRYDAETWKEQVRRKFIGTETVDLPDGTRIERGISTTTLDSADYSAMIDRVCAWATELGAEIER